MTEELSIQRAKEGDRFAQKALFDQYKVKWYMTCMRYMGNKADADDAIQNGMIKIFTKISQFDPQLGNFNAWTSRIMVNECIMLLRKHQSKRTVENLDAVTNFYDYSETPIDRLSKEEVMKLVQNLPDGYRMVFNMYVIEGFSHKEIAKQLNISEGTSKSQLFKARRMLKEAIEVMI